MSEHTPGPWRVLDGQIIQTNHLTRDVWVIPMNEADLQLMAAAPEMEASLIQAQSIGDSRAHHIQELDGDIRRLSRIAQAGKELVRAIENEGLSISGYHAAEERLDKAVENFQEASK